MESRPDLTLEEQITAALDWWRDAGVDHDYAEEPQRQLSDPAEEEAARSQPAPLARPVEEVPKVKLGGEETSWPTSLEAFQQWWTSETSLDDAPVGSRVAPRGNKHADLMVIVPMPELDDRDTLLSGNQGVMVGNMLRAMGIAPEKSYLASALPRHMPAADWKGLAESGLGAVLLHHLELAAPKRLLVLGRDILPLIGLVRSQTPQQLQAGGASIQALASFAPEGLLQNARLRADLWRRWLDWTG